VLQYVIVFDFLSMTVKEFNFEEKDKWNSFVMKHPFSNILQTWEWGEVKKGKSWEVLRLGVFHKNAQIAAAQILVRNLPFHFQLYYSPYGPVIDWEMPYAQEILENIRAYLKDLSDNRHLMWKIEPPLTSNEAQKYKALEALEKIGFAKANESIQPQHTIIVDLTKKENDLLESFEKDTRYSIRRAYKEDVEIKEFSNPLNNQPVKEFYDLYSTTSKRGKFPAREWQQFARLWEEMAPHAARCYQAWYKDKLLASSIVLTLNKKAYLVYAGSIRDPEYRNKFPSYLMQWETMLNLKKDGFESYDLWGVVPKEQKDHPWSGISLFKRGFKGTEKNYIGAYDLSLSPFYDFYKTLNKLRYKITSHRQ